MNKINPNGVGLKNGNVFGFEVSEEVADVVIIPVPWDATSSYGTGSSNGPEAILEASTQLDFVHPELKKAWKQNLFMLPVSKEWKEINEQLRFSMMDYHYCLESGEELTDDLRELQKTINEAQIALRKGVKKRAIELLNRGKTPVVLGGEHSVALGLIQALSEQNKKFGILQIDAHADLRKNYEGLKQSHASIMFNSLKNSSVNRLVQVGVRDLCDEEMKKINSDKRIKTYFDWDLQKDKIQGKSWSEKVAEIISDLPKNVYISFDIDGLSPDNCPNTGTPVPGGLSFSEARYLLIELAKSDKKIIGFDLCEVSPGQNEWDANVGARMLWELCSCLKINEKIRLK